MSDSRNSCSADITYLVRKPVYTFDRLVVDERVIGELKRCVSLLSHKELIFDEWGLGRIMPYRGWVYNFYGNPGTGKSLAAEALASALGKNILDVPLGHLVRLNRLPMSIRTVFQDAENQDAILFVDCADSLLFSNVTDERIASIRLEFLACFREFSCVVIFSSNVIRDYANGFEGIVRGVEFSEPDESQRCRIWRVLLPPSFPVSKEVTPERLAKIGVINGREIRNVILAIAMEMVGRGIMEASLEMFETGIMRSVAHNGRGRDVADFELEKE